MWKEMGITFIQDKTSHLQNPKTHVNDRQNLTSKLFLQQIVGDVKQGIIQAIHSISLIRYWGVPD